jgi:hypothetical protein
MDPTVAAVRREALEGGKLERVVLDAQAAPLASQHVQTLSNWLGEPTFERLAPVAGDVAAFEAVLRGGSLFPGGEHHLFGALRNADPAIALDPRAGLVARILQSQLQGLQGYLGAWPEPGFLRFLGGASAQPADAAGYTRLPLGQWRLQANGFTLLSFHPEILAQVAPQLRFEKAERPAQIRLRAGDLANSTLAPLVNAYGYRQSRAITLGNTRFLNMLVEQLHVPPAEGIATGEKILGAKFVAPLGGTYELRKWEGGAENWIATALVDRPNAAPPPDYQFPALRWLRGADVELALQKGPQPSLAVHGEFVMPVEARSGGFQLPSFSFGKPKGDAKKAEPEKPKPSGKREF